VIESGTAFHQSDKQFAETWALNSPIMSYAAKIADKPYELVKGPDILDVLVAANAPGIKKGTARLSAQVSEMSTGQQAIKAAEWVLDPKIEAGKGTALAAGDGAFDSPTEVVTGDLPAPTGERQLVYVRAQDAKGNWGPATAQWLAPAATKPPNTR
jgi:hypothetical protein